MVGFTLSAGAIAILLGVVADAEISNSYPEKEAAFISDLKMKLQTFEQSGIVVCDPEDYQVMIDDQIFLQCLQAAGVDNWDGYEYAQEMMEEDFE